MWKCAWKEFLPSVGNVHGKKEAHISPKNSAVVHNVSNVTTILGVEDGRIVC